MEQLSPEDGGIRWLVLRGLGGIYLIAFLSLAVQVDGLIGSAGIVPVASYLPSAWDQLGWEAIRRIPTLAWLWHSDWALRCYAYAGALGGLMALVEWAIVPALTACWVLYLSLTAAGQIFLSYQWDMLLLEAGLLGLFLPFTRWPGTSIRSPSGSIRRACSSCTSRRSPLRSCCLPRAGCGDGPRRRSPVSRSRSC